jgi:hypothetical protein
MSSSQNVTKRTGPGEESVSDGLTERGDLCLPSEKGFLKTTFRLTFNDLTTFGFVSYDSHCIESFLMNSSLESVYT